MLPIYIIRSILEVKYISFLVSDYSFFMFNYIIVVDKALSSRWPNYAAPVSVRAENCHAYAQNRLSKHLEKDQEFRSRGWARAFIRSNNLCLGRVEA